MKGIIFTEFLELLEAEHSPDFVDELIDAAALPGDGSYTSVGTYPCSELVSLLSAYGARVGEPMPDVLRGFGERLFARFSALYPEFFPTDGNVFHFLEKVDAYIHMEVRKLYPEAELPSFEHEHLGPDCMRMVYRSSRPLASLAEGLILGCAAHFDDAIELEVRDLSAGAGTSAEFVLRRLPRIESGE